LAAVLLRNWSRWSRWFFIRPRKRPRRPAMIRHRHSPRFFVPGRYANGFRRALDRFFYRDRLDYRRHASSNSERTADQRSCGFDPMLGSVMDRIFLKRLLVRPSRNFVGERHAARADARSPRSMGVRPLRILGFLVSSSSRPGPRLPAGALLFLSRPVRARDSVTPFVANARAAGPQLLCPLAVSASTLWRCSVSAKRFDGRFSVPATTSNWSRRLLAMLLWP